MRLVFSQNQTTIVYKLLVAFTCCLLILSMLQRPSPVHASVSGGASVSIMVTFSNLETINNGAAVTLKSDALPFPLISKTDSSGIAVFPNLPSGNYSFFASYPGYVTSSIFSTETLAAGQTYSRTVQLVYNSELKGLDRVNFYDTSNNNIDTSNNNGSVTGTVSWTTYGTIPTNTKMQVQFYNDQNVATGTVISSVYSTSSSNYSFTMPNTALPVNATRIGVKLLIFNSFVIAEKTIPLWSWRLHSAGNVQFKDTNPHGGAIDGSVTWTDAADESTIAGYRIFYWVNGDSYWKYWDVVARHIDRNYQYAYTSLPANIGSILIGTNNIQGEELNYYPSVSVIDNRLSDPISVLTATYSSSIPMPSNITDNTHTSIPESISGLIYWTRPADYSLIKGYNLYFSNPNGDKLQAIGTIYSASDRTNATSDRINLSYNMNQPLTVPSGATQFALYSLGYDGKESAPVYLPVKTAPGSDKLPKNIKFMDMDKDANKLRGFITWDRALDESTLSKYTVWFLDNNNNALSLLGNVPKGAYPILTLPANTPIPSGAIKIGIYAQEVNSSPSSINRSIPLIDNTSLSIITNAARTNYFPNISKVDVKQIVNVLRDKEDILPFTREDIQLFLSMVEPKFLD